MHPPDGREDAKERGATDRVTGDDPVAGGGSGTATPGAGGRPLVEHRDALPRYAPPGHTGTVNVRLVDRGFGAGLELVHGTLDPGGAASRHRHATEHQVVYILSGRARVQLGDAKPLECDPGTVVRIPPGLDHEVVNIGDSPLELLVIYSPPLAPRTETRLD
jgi:quercetin dioxygenase-like cupin family protein